MTSVTCDNIFRFILCQLWFYLSFRHKITPHPMIFQRFVIQTNRWHIIHVIHVIHIHGGHLIILNLIYAN